MGITCGTDMIEIARIKEAIERSGEKFLNEIFTEREIEFCRSKNRAQYQHFAARFAAKEAIFKAISCYLENKYDVTWKDIEIWNEENGRPKVKFLKKELEKITMDISMSHCKDYAIANVIAVYGKE